MQQERQMTNEHRNLRRFSEELLDGFFWTRTAPQEVRLSRMASVRSSAWWLSLASASDDDCRRLQQIGDNPDIVKKCAIKREADGLTALFFFSVDSYRHGLYAHELVNDVVHIGALGDWQSTARNQRDFDAFAREAQSTERHGNEHGGARRAHSAPSVSNNALQPDVSSSAAQPDAPRLDLLPDVSMPDAPPQDRTLTPHDAYTAKGLTPKAPRDWTSLADVLPALKVSSSPPGETPEQCLQRLQLHQLMGLEQLDPSHFYPDDRQYHFTPSGQLLLFLFALHCIATGAASFNGLDFCPEHWIAPNHVTAGARTHTPSIYTHTRALSHTRRAV
jgi:hypothetical protein